MRKPSRKFGRRRGAPSRNAPPSRVAPTSTDAGEVAGIPVHKLREMVDKDGGWLRGGNTLLGLGSPIGGVAIPGGSVDSPVLAYQVKASAVLRHLQLSGGGAADVLLTRLTNINDNLISGFVPISMFAPDSFHQPLVGRTVDINSPLDLVLRKTSAGALTLYPSWVVQGSPLRGGRFGRPAIHGKRERSLIAIGADQEYTVAAGGSQVLNFEIAEEGVIDRLVIEAAAGAELQVIDVSYDNHPLTIRGTVEDADTYSAFSWSNPSFGFYVQVAHVLTVEVRSVAAAGGPYAVAAGFTVL